MKKNYRKRTQQTRTEDLIWLRTAREKLRAAVTEGFPNGTWPLAAPAMDRVLKALGVLQHTLHGAIMECRAAAGVSTEHKENEWLGFPPPRR